MSHPKQTLVETVEQHVTQHGACVCAVQIGGHVQRQRQIVANVAICKTGFGGVTI